MGKNKQSHKIKIIFSLSNINADFLQLILTMLVSHYILGNPVYGGGLFLFANIWTLYFQGKLHSIKYPRRNGASFIMWILLTASVFAGLALIFFYPIIRKEPAANYVSFFVLILTARNILTYWVNRVYNQRKKSHRIYKILFQFLFLVPCIFFAVKLLEGAVFYIVIGGFAITGFLLSFQSSTLASFGKYIRKFNQDKMGEIVSYKIFSNMTLYSQIAFSLGILMYIFYISFSGQSFSVNSYVMMGLWLIIMLFSSEFFTWIAGKRKWVLNLNLFIIGAVLWIVGSINMFGEYDIIRTFFWTLFWGFGLSSITAVTNRYTYDFKMVARIANQKVAEKDLHFRSLLIQIVAVIFSNTIMLCVLTLWAFVVPSNPDPGVPGMFRSIMIQLPVVFMLISIFFALKQPLDDRIRQKLVHYHRNPEKNDPTRENLSDRLVRKARVKFGIKIVAAVVRPFLHLKVLGKGNMDYKNFPSIFVCNHGLFYGPIAAVIYLPTYFRPWVDKKMVYLDLCSREIYDRALYRAPVISEKMKRMISRILARPVTWALNSFNPIPVEKNSLRNVMTTFDSTVKVLAEGDNVLIFPEKPKRVKKGKKMTVEHETETVGNLYTGFASIGKMYYDKTGKSLRFYPIYANKKGHTFKIGEPVIFNPENPPRDEKHRIAEELHNRMLVLRE